MLRNQQNVEISIKQINMILSFAYDTLITTNIHELLLQNFIEY